MEDAECIWNASIDFLFLLKNRFGTVAVFAIANALSH